MQLDYAQRRSLYEQGFVKVEGVIPLAMVNAARRAINGSLGRKGMNESDLPILQAQSYCPELRKDPIIRGLVQDTPAWSLAESVIGQGKLNPVHDGQIALRFPRPIDPDTPPGAARPHLDGMYTPTNGVPKGTIGNFTALIGVFLSDVPGPNCGNFTVWPGTHRQHEAWFRKHGPQSLLEGLPKIDLPPALPVTARAGDIVLAHYLLGHGISPNYSPNIRYACFYRLNHVDHEKQKWDTMSDAWLEWPGVRAVAEEASTAA